MINLYNMDCMEALQAAPDNYWDLSIVDPPYGMFKMGMQTGGVGKNKVFNRNELKKWDIQPTQKYFDELRRVSKHQIIWGGNYFTDKLPPKRCWVVWDKVQYMPTYSKHELAWTSFDSQCEIYKYRNIYQGKIHPTQKPIALYTWLLSKYAKKGNKILDTHLGSGSSAIAAHKAGYDFWGYEIDKDYFKAASKRLKEAQKQLLLF
jgi:site-specific DNA-methyltransferase (adenine-specific)